MFFTLTDFSQSVSMFQEFRRRISQLAAIKFPPGQVASAFFVFGKNELQFLLCTMISH